MSRRLRFRIALRRARIHPGNHRAVVPGRRRKALGELGHAQVFVKLWTLRVIKVVQQLSKFSLITQRQVNCLFTPSYPAPPEQYVGTITKVGLDIGATAAGRRFCELPDLLIRF